MNDVINWRRLNERLTTSGQPTETQFANIKALGVSHVINLAPNDNKDALADEASILARMGFQYTYIPVDFSAPTQDDFDSFCAAMTRSSDAPVHVHCIYNARVSAFFYRYALEGRGGSVEDAFNRMDGIWRPGGVWAEFISDWKSVDLPNRYAGYDYS